MKKKIKKLFQDMYELMLGVIGFAMLILLIVFVELFGRIFGMDDSMLYIQGPEPEDI